MYLTVVIKKERDKMFDKKYILVAAAFLAFLVMIGTIIVDLLDLKMAVNTDTESSAIISEGSIVSENSEEFTSDFSSAEESELTGKDYYQSDEIPPSEDECLAIQKEVLENCTDEEYRTIFENINWPHMIIESEMINSNLWDRLKDPDSDSWQAWERTGKMVINNVPIQNNRDKNYYLDSLDTVIQILGEDNPLIPDLEEMKNLIEEGVENHDVTKIFKFHQMIHDCDYWIISYPIYFESIAPPDWSGVERYYNALEIFQ